jgi:hypothetical protein
MSIIGNFRAVSPRLLAALQDDPSLIRTVLAAGNEVAPSRGAPPVMMAADVRKYVETLPDEQRASFLKEYANYMARFRDVLEGLYGTREERSEALREAGLTTADCGTEISVDKAWQGLHFLLCGNPWGGELPLSHVVTGGEAIGEDQGYGPARYLTPFEVQEAAAALSAVSEGQLEARFDPEAMNAADIYPGNWEDEENLPWVLDAFREVRQYYADASRKGYAMLIYLT